MQCLEHPVKIRRGRDTGSCSSRVAEVRALIVGEGPGWSSRRAATTSSVGWTGGSCKSAAQARRSATPSWISVATRETAERQGEHLRGQIEICGLAGFARGPGNGCPQVISDTAEPIETSTPHFVVLAKGVGDARTNARRVSRSVQDPRVPVGNNANESHHQVKKQGICGKGEAEENQATDSVERRNVLSDRNEGSHQRRRTHLGSPPLGKQD